MIHRDNAAAAIEETLPALQQNNFAAFTTDGAYLVSSATEHDNKSEHIGQYRVKFHFNKVGKTTVMSQAIKDNDNQFTFRKWNPNKLRVSYGCSTEVDSDYLPFCCLCSIIGK